MAAAYPSGIGTQDQAYQATAAMRQEPWYASMLKAWGLQNPPEGKNGGNPVDAQGNPAKLSDEQRQAVMEAANHYGIGMNNKFDQIDENGQISEAHHKLKKILIGAAIGGAALTGLGAAGIGPLAGAFGGSAAVGADVAGANALGGGGVLAGLPGAMTTLPAIGGAAGTVGTVAAAGSTAAKVAAAAKAAKTGVSVGSTLSDILKAGGEGIGAATTASGQNRLNQEQLGLAAVTADLSQRKAALQDVARASAAGNPRVSPFDPVGARKFSDDYTSTLSQLAAQGKNRLQSPLSNVTPSTVEDATGQKKGTLEKIGDYAGPIASVASRIPWDRIHF